MKTFTKKFILENCGCYHPKNDNKIWACSFMKKDGKEITLLEIVESEIPDEDKFWFICHQVANEEENIEIAIKIIEAISPICEKHFPGKKYPERLITHLTNRKGESSAGELKNLKEIFRYEGVCSMSKRAEYCMYVLECAAQIPDGLTASPAAHWACCIIDKDLWERLEEILTEYANK